MRVPEFLKKHILTHDTGEFRFRYLLFPPTGRRVIDIVFDLLSLATVIGVWMAYFLHLTPGMPILGTVIILVCIGNAYRNFRTVNRGFGQVLLDDATKVRYTHEMHADAFGVALFCAWKYLSWGTDFLPRYLYIALPFVFLLYMIALPFIFHTIKIVKQNETNH